MSDIGLLTVEDGRARFVTSVTVDGVDVRARCQACDDRRGWAIVFVLDANGRYTPDAAGTSLKRALLTGHVDVTIQDRALAGGT